MFRFIYDRLALNSLDSIIQILCLFKQRALCEYGAMDEIQMKKGCFAGELTNRLGHK